jgi:hypothetical protein
MARIRSVKPGFRTSLTVTSWPRDVRLFFALLWGYCDDYGRGVDEPRLIKADCFPLDDDITAATVDEWLDLMAKTDTVRRYRVGGRRFLWIPDWSEHQKPQHPKASEHPAWEMADPEPGADLPDTGSDHSERLEQLDEELMRASRVSHEYLTPKGEGRVVGEGEGEDNHFSSEDADASPDGQDEIPSGKNDRDDVKGLCQLLADLMVKNESKRPRITKVWLDECRRMIDIDKRDPVKAAALLEWCQKDPFWRANIQSMPTFRQQYDQLRLKAMHEWETRQNRLASDNRVFLDNPDADFLSDRRT